MAALTDNRDTPEMANLMDGYAARALPQEAATTIFAGSIVMTSADGRAAPGATATGRISLGRCEKKSVNAGADGAVKVLVKPGTFRFGNSAAGDQITDADIGKDCYIVDDQTVAKTDGTGTRSIAGKVIEVDSVGVWVAVGLKALNA